MRRLVSLSGAMRILGQQSGHMSRSTHGVPTRTRNRPSTCVVVRTRVTRKSLVSRRHMAIHSQRAYSRISWLRWFKPSSGYFMSPGSPGLCGFGGPSRVPLGPRFQAESQIEGRVAHRVGVKGRKIRSAPSSGRLEEIAQPSAILDNGQRTHPGGVRV